jgi:hypothetical protein
VGCHAGRSPQWVPGGRSRPGRGRGEVEARSRRSLTDYSRGKGELQSSYTSSAWVPIGLAIGPQRRTTGGVAPKARATDGSLLGRLSSLDRRLSNAVASVLPEASPPPLLGSHNCQPRTRFPAAACRLHQANLQRACFQRPCPPPIALRLSVPENYHNTIHRPFIPGRPSPYHSATHSSLGTAPVQCRSHVQPGARPE